MLLALFAILCTKIHCNFLNSQPCKALITLRPLPSWRPGPGEEGEQEPHQLSPECLPPDGDVLLLGEMVGEEEPLPRGQALCVPATKQGLTSRYRATVHSSRSLIQLREIHIDL